MTEFSGIPAYNPYLEELYAVEISPGLVSDMTDAVINEIKAWQFHPPDVIYPIIFPTSPLQSAASFTLRTHRIVEHRITQNHQNRPSITGKPL